MEYLWQVVWKADCEGHGLLYSDTLVGTDSHTTMTNGLAILGWGVGGIEAEAAMLGQPISTRIPDVVGMRLTGRLREGVTATDLVLTVTERLRQQGVVGKFQACRYLETDFGISKSPKSTRQRDNHCALTVLLSSRFRIAHKQLAARALLHHNDINDSTAFRMPTPIRL